MHPTPWLFPTNARIDARKLLSADHLQLTSVAERAFGNVRLKHPAKRAPMLHQLEGATQSAAALSGYSADIRSRVSSMIIRAIKRGTTCQTSSLLVCTFREQRVLSCGPCHWRLSWTYPTCDPALYHQPQHGALPNEHLPCGPKTPQSTTTVYPSCLITGYRAHTDCQRMQTKTLSDDAPRRPITNSVTCRNAYDRDFGQVKHSSLCASAGLVCLL